MDIGGLISNAVGLVNNPIGTIIGAGLDFFGQQNTNDANQDINNRNLAFNSAEALNQRLFESKQARLNRSFQRDMFAMKNAYDTRMSNSAVARRMADLRRAGINPILAGKYDATSPTAGVFSGSTGHGSAATAGHMIPMQNELGSVFSSAKEGAMISNELERLRVEVNNMKTTGALTEDQRVKTLEEQRKIRAETDLKRLESLLVAEKTITAPHEREKIKTEIGHLATQISKDRSQTELTDTTENIKRRDLPGAQLKEKLMEYPLRGFETLERWLNDKSGDVPNIMYKHRNYRGN